MNNISQILRSNISDKNIVYTKGICENRHDDRIKFARNMCKNCGDLRCERCITSDNMKCVGCVKTNIENGDRCSECRGIIWKRICVICSEPIPLCQTQCSFYENKYKFVIRFGYRHVCKKCYQD